MTRKTQIMMRTAMIFGAMAACVAVADDFDLDWWTVDGGGATWSTGGGFELGGTIGQADAGEVVMIGGAFELVGGFWAAPPCWCMSDMNNDGVRDGADIQAFVDCMLSGGADCACADLNRDGALDVSDIGTFVGDLLTGAACP